MEEPSRNESEQQEILINLYYTPDISKKKGKPVNYTNLKENLIELKKTRCAKPSGAKIYKYLF